MRPACNPAPRAAFSLMELLTVIAIIAVLAAIAVGLTAAAKNARINSRGQTSLKDLETAIEAYKGDLNSYPPDNAIPGGIRPVVDPVVNPLFYELHGMEVVNNAFRLKGSSADPLTPTQVERVFNRRGFLNTTATASEPARSYYDPKGSAVARETIHGVPVQLLVTPFPWAPGSSEPKPLAAYGVDSRANPWRYVSTNPTNNHGGYDLWSEVYVGKEKRVFKNW